MFRFLAVSLLCVILFASTACESLSRADHAHLREIQAAGLDVDAPGVKSPTTAGVLNLLPGIGNFYLASGTDASGQWIYGTLNLLMWPLSVVWGIPQAAIDARTINQREAVYYYRYDPRGREEFRAATGTGLD